MLLVGQELRMVFIQRQRLGNPSSRTGMIAGQHRYSPDALLSQKVDCFTRIVARPICNGHGADHEALYGHEND